MQSRSVIGVAGVFAGLLLATVVSTVSAQDPNYGYQGYQNPNQQQPVPPPPGQQGYYQGYQDPAQTYPGYGQPQQQPVQQQPPVPPPEAESKEEDEPSTTITGFELGLNWMGNAKVALQPGWCFGRWGLYLLFGLDAIGNHENAKTADDTQLVNPSAPAQGANTVPGWSEKVAINTKGVTYDLGIAGRFYVFDELKEQAIQLFVELDLGWRGASFSSEIDWRFTGDGDLIDFNGDGTISPDEEEDFEDDRNAYWNNTAADYAEDQKEKYDGFFLNLGAGGEYLLPGGLGIAGDAGISLFYNSKWEQRYPFGYDDEPALDDFSWRRDVKYTGRSTQFGFYYNLALRYHF